MGRKIENLKRRSSEGAESLKKSSEMAKSVLKDSTELKSLLDSMPKDVDDEIVQSISNVYESTKSEVSKDIESNVKPVQELGKKTLESVSTGIDEIAKNNAEVQSIFDKMDSISKYGSDMRNRSSNEISKSNRELSELDNENKKMYSDSVRDFDKTLDDIINTF